MKVALIGSYGHQGYVINGTKELSDCQMTAIAASDELEDISRIVNGYKNEKEQPKPYSDWREMLDREKPDAVGVSPMFCNHQKISVECLKRNIHVMSEKPVAMNLEELEELKEVYSKSDAEFVGMHAMRYQPNFRAGYEALKAGLIGKPILINSQKSYAFSLLRPHFYKERDKFGSSLCWVAIHAIDWTYWMMGGFENVFATHTTEGNMGYDACESSGVIAFKLKDCGQGCINFDFLKAQKDTIPQDRCRIAGDKGVIEIYDRKAFIVTHDEELRELELKPEESFFKSFIESIQGKGECLLNAEDTFEVTRLALLARDSADKNILVNC
jgi:predicted dehydrogenase